MAFFCPRAMAPETSRDSNIFPIRTYLFGRIVLLMVQTGEHTGAGDGISTRIERNGVSIRRNEDSVWSRSAGSITAGEGVPQVTNVAMKTSAVRRRSVRERVVRAETLGAVDGAMQ